MATTNDLGDQMGRALINATPGTSAATDYLGRAITAGDKDYRGVGLQASASYPPPNWVATHAYTLGTLATLPGGAILKVTTAGTSASTAPTAPAVGSNVTDGTAVWKRVK